MDAASTASRMFHVVVVVVDIDIRSPLPMLLDPDAMDGDVVIFDLDEDEEVRPGTLLLSDEKMSSKPPSSSTGNDSGTALVASPLLDPSVNATSGKKLSFPPPPLEIDCV